MVVERKHLLYILKEIEGNDLIKESELIDTLAIEKHYPSLKMLVNPTFISSDGRVSEEALLYFHNNGHEIEVSYPDGVRGYMILTIHTNKGSIQFSPG